MEYRQAVSELFYLQKYAIKLGLDNIAALTRYLNYPHKNYPVIHIAGTNGKGSTAFFTAAVLQAMGLKAGLFTSPHLQDFRERIRVNGKIIDEASVVRFWQNVKEEVLKRKATFFDTTTAMGLDYFSSEEVDVAVIETGLGGRLDSTNIVNSEIVAITPIDFDHQKQLGDTLEKIAYEKAGIIKENSAVFCAKQQTEALRILKSAKTKKFYYLPDYIRVVVKSASLDKMEFDIYDDLNDTILKNIVSRQVGVYQAENIALAYFMARYFLSQHGINFDKNLFKEQIKKILWPGRLQKISSNPDIIFDVSHNPAGIKTTLNYLSDKTERDKLHILLGLVEDKAYNEIVDFISLKCDAVYLTEPDTHRKLDGTLLLQEFRKRNKEALFIENAREAYRIAKSRLKEKDTLLVIGSHYLIGAIISEIKNN
jgi:dihydrofolate synthase/folylpolyglutamate synthase